MVDCPPPSSLTLFLWGAPDSSPHPLMAELMTLWERTFRRQLPCASSVSTGKAPPCDFGATKDAGCGTQSPELGIQPCCRQFPPPPPPRPHDLSQGTSSLYAQCPLGSLPVLMSPDSHSLAIQLSGMVTPIHFVLPTNYILLSSSLPF